MKKTLPCIIAFLISLTAAAQWDKDVIQYRGRLALQDGKYAAAIEQFNILASLDTTDYWTYFYRGIAKYNLADIHGARKDFDRSVRLNPVFTNGYHYRAIARSRSGEYEEALKDLEKAISLRPGFTGLYYSRGVTYFLAQRFEEAVADFDKYIMLESKDPSAYLNRGASHLFLRDTLKALDDYNYAIKLDRFESEGYIRRGRLYAASGEFEKALDDLNKALDLDPDNSFAHFNRALMLYETKDYRGAMADMDRVLDDEPGNTLTLYNRSLLKMELNDFGGALDDINRVLDANPGNVLALFNRAGIYIELKRFRDAIRDYGKAIELYPDFVKAYRNRAYVENLIGMHKEAEKDYRTAEARIEQYRKNNGDGSSAFADTSGRFNALIALDADFARKDFNDELLQNRDIDIRLRPMARFVACKPSENENAAFAKRYENPSVDGFIASRGGRLQIALENPDAAESGLAPAGEDAFESALDELGRKQFNSALRFYNKAASDSASAAAMAFCYMNRAVLRAEMTAFIANMENNVQTLSMDDGGTAKTRVGDRGTRNYDYSEAIADMERAAALAPDVCYVHYDLGNLRCLNSQPVEAIASYNRAIELYPEMGDAYFNRALVLIFLKDKEKGCIDLSRAGELGVPDAYSVIKKYCKTDD